MAYMVLHAAPMKLTPTSIFFSASILALTSLAGCAADTSEDAQPGADEEVAESSEEALTGAPSNYGYFMITRRDFRRCISPICGGFYVKRVNEATTLCADGSRQAECYVSSVTYGGIGLSAREEDELRGAVESGKALIKARTYKKKFNGNYYGTLKANEGWLGATGSTPDGTFYRAADNGIRCITTPCPSTSVSQLNGSSSYNVIDVKLGNTANKASQESLNTAAYALGTKDGILIAGGIALPKCIPGSKCGPLATASEFYLRIVRREGKSCGGHTINGWVPCNAGQYCSYTAADICGAADAPGTCQYKPEVCNKMFAPVCACDGKTYSNECMAAAGGASVSSQGACGK